MEPRGAGEPKICFLESGWVGGNEALPDRAESSELALTVFALVQTTRTFHCIVLGRRDRPWTADVAGTASDVVAVRLLAYLDDLERRFTW